MLRLFYAIATTDAIVFYPRMVGFVEMVLSRRMRRVQQGVASNREMGRI